MYEFLPIATPIAAGFFGIISGVLVFSIKIKKLHNAVKSDTMDKTMLKELIKNTNKANRDLTTKINYLVEEMKELKTNECKTCKTKNDNL